MSMKALEFVLKGDSKVVEIPKPTPGENEVLIKVVASAIDTGLDAVVQNTFSGGFLHSTNAPVILGWHYSGIVEAVGNKVAAGLEEGQEVWGHLQYDASQKQGSFSEYIVVNQEDCAVKPSNVSFNLAAAASTEAMTALQAIRDEGGLAKGKSILVIGGAGAVGSAGVCIAKQLGAHVTASCSTKDVETVKDMYGADEVIDRNKVDILKENMSFDVVFDSPAAYNATSCLKLLNDGGAYVATLPSLNTVLGMFVTTFFSSKTVKFVLARSKREDLELVGKWLQEGGLQIPIDSTYNVQNIKSAIERYSSRENKGRVVIEVQDGF